MYILDALAKRLHALENVDKYPHQRLLRTLQAAWREEKQYPIGTHTGPRGERLLGSRLAMPFARHSLANYLHEDTRQVVREEVLDPERSKGKLYQKPRIFNDLLSSQPLAFNLFAIPSRDLDLATEWFRLLTGDHGVRVTSIDFEWSPGRGDDRYTGDKSAFDVFVQYRNGDGQRAFLGIEVKYHEHLHDKPATLRPRHEEVAQQIGWFKQESLPALRSKPLQQVWRDHLLAASMLLVEDFDHGQFVMLYPAVNTTCQRVIADYVACLIDDRSFCTWTIEHAVRALRETGAGNWVDEFHSRYLDVSKLEQLGKSV